MTATVSFWRAMQSRGQKDELFSSQISGFCQAEGAQERKHEDASASLTRKLVVKS